MSSIYKLFRVCLFAFCILGLLQSQVSAAHSQVQQQRPNILWIVVEDMSSHFGYQGEKLVETPHVDRLAKQGVVFSNAYVTAPVCSACRSAMITGMYQTTIGAHHHRSSRGALKIQLPEEITTVPEIFRAAGYHTCNMAYDASKPDLFSRLGKEDYNFVYDRKKMYDGADWSKRKAGQPLFAQVQLRGGKLRNVPRWYDEVVSGLDHLVQAEDVTLPPYYPDHPAIREDWAAYLNSVQYTDKEVGLLIAKLKRENDLDNTIIFFLTDHGISHARGKQFLYDEGAKVPFVVWGANQNPKHQVRHDVIAHIDMTATSLDMAGIELPQYMQGRVLFGPDAKPRKYVVTARDRCDETVDRIRGVRQGKYKYIRNYYPHRPYLQPCAYKDGKPYMAPLRELYAAGKLNKAQSLHLAETRPEEELYDLEADPFEVHNLAGDSAHQKRLKKLRAQLKKWELESDDRGRFPEDEAMYDSDMAGYKKKNPQIQKNIDLMKKWKSEGK
ncbi:MAG: sulfatase [Planctomycetaceae bacterium]|nr:sulfatase [Planctomycetaceae bacterium]